MFAMERASTSRAWPVLLVQLFLLSAIVAPVCAADTDAPDRFVAVTGQGEVLAEPDQALVVLGVEARNTELDAARAQVNRGVQNVLELTRELGIEDDRVQATRISVRPEYDYGPERGEQRFRGYYVARQVSVDLRDLDKLGTLIERAIDLGVNQLGDPQLDSSKRRELEREALALAVEDARRNAETLARAAGATVGRVRMLSSSMSAVAPPVPYRMVAAAAESGAADTYVSGEMSFTATVEAKYDLTVSSAPR